jgi:small subunit ribosomal protein S16
MALKIRLRQQGCNNRPFYRVVVTDVRSPRDGKYLEALGWYNPFGKELNTLVKLDSDRLQFWLDHGAEISERVENLLGKGAPTVLKQYREKNLARQLKATAKRRELRKQKKKAVGAKA